MQENWSEFREKYPYYLDTVAKDGKPIMTGNFGDWDIRASVLSGRMPQLIRYIDEVLEDAAVTVRNLQEQGKNVRRFPVVIMNKETHKLIPSKIYCQPNGNFMFSLLETDTNLNVIGFTSKCSHN